MCLSLCLCIDFPIRVVFAFSAFLLVVFLHHDIGVLLAVLTESEAKVKADLHLRSDPLSQARYNHWEGLSCVLLDAKLAKIVAQTPREDVPVRVYERRDLVTDTNLHDLFISTQLLGHNQMLSGVQSRTPNKQSAIFTDAGRVAPCNNVLYRHIL